MELGLAGKTALVLGASRGIGRAIAQGLISEGASVAIAARGKDDLARTAVQIGAAAHLVCDLNEPGSGKRLVSAVSDRLSPPDIVVCNTGGPARSLFKDTTAQDWNQGFQSLWMSVVETAQAAYPHMAERGWGRIILITSTAGKEPQPGLTIASSLRTGLHGLVRIMSNEFGSAGITTNAILPGFVLTERLRQSGFPIEKAGQLIPAGKIAEPSDIADLSAFLASNRAGYISGQLIACDGGFLKGM